jgi:hypothetical protein
MPDHSREEARELVAPLLRENRTVEEIAETTGLSLYQVRLAARQLKREAAFSPSRWSELAQTVGRAEKAEQRIKESNIRHRRLVVRAARERLCLAAASKAAWKQYGQIERELRFLLAGLTPDQHLRFTTAWARCALGRSEETEKILHQTLRDLWPASAEGFWSPRMLNSLVALMNKEATQYSSGKSVPVEELQPGRHRILVHTETLIAPQTELLAPMTVAGTCVQENGTYRIDLEDGTSHMFIPTTYVRTTPVTNPGWLAVVQDAPIS